MGAIEPAIGVDGGADQRLDLLVAGHVGPHEAGVSTGRLDQAHRLVSAFDRHVGDHHLGALAREGQGRGPADSRAGSSDERYLAGQPLSH